MAAVGKEGRPAVVLAARDGQSCRVRKRPAVGVHLLQRRAYVPHEDDRSLFAPRAAASDDGRGDGLNGSRRGVELVQLGAGEERHVAAIWRPEWIRRVLGAGKFLVRIRPQVL